jgi:transposase
VFLDESSVNCGMTRLYGRAMASQRVNDYVPDVRFERTSVISALRLGGAASPMVFKGTLNGKLFKKYVTDFLAPTLKKGDILVLDNLSSHKVAGSLNPVFRRGASVMFLPPYSPDFNPIEMSWSKMKSVLKKLKPRTPDQLFAALRTALGSFTKSDIENWFAHDGYTTNI